MSLLGLAARSVGEGGAFQSWLEIFWTEGGRGEKKKWRKIRGEEGESLRVSF